MHLGTASHVMCFLIPLSSGFISVPNTKLFQTAAAFPGLAVLGNWFLLFPFFFK